MRKSKPPPKLIPLLDPANQTAFTHHHRTWLTNRYIYPVISRRSGGVSIGVNLNPDKICNFDCIYCSVDRKIPGNKPDIHLPTLETELAAMIQLVNSGEIFSRPPFTHVTPPLRRLNDIAFSGDGEPTTCSDLLSCLKISATELLRANLRTVKLVLITNATMLHRTGVENALSFMDEHNGEIWAKLDAGTAGYYAVIDRTAVPFQRILDNIEACAKKRAIVIQTLLMRVHGKPPTSDEITAYINRLRNVLAGGGAIKLVQIYTVARQPAESFATPLNIDELNSIAARIRATIPDLPVDVFP